MQVAIAGNIGAGKTTLTRLLAKHYKWDAHYEDVVDNPYLDDFYHSMDRWSFNLQIYFLNSRFRQVLGYRKYKPPFCSSSEVSYLKFPHSFTAQAPILTAGPA
ncbi:deoxynucleoside kinase [Citrobacter braakii]